MRQKERKKIPIQMDSDDSLNGKVKLLCFWIDLDENRNKNS